MSWQAHSWSSRSDGWAGCLRRRTVISKVTSSVVRVVRVVDPERQRRRRRPRRRTRGLGGSPSGATGSGRCADEADHARGGRRRSRLGCGAIRDRRVGARPLRVRCADIHQKRSGDLQPVERQDLAADERPKQRRAVGWWLGVGRHRQPPRSARGRTSSSRRTARRTRRRRRSSEGRAARIARSVLTGTSSGSAGRGRRQEPRTDSIRSWSEAYAEPVLGASRALARPSRPVGTVLSMALTGHHEYLS